ncbi:MAG TPA: c-type cytochrome [Gemmatales bacterium]|nr:c-type cytochrome [Gemmatales bacterium]
MAGHGFAPTSAAIHPKTGDLYVASGGRGIAGAIYRIRHDAGFQSKLQITNLLEPKAIGASLQSTSEKPTTEISVMIENWKKAKDNEEELYWLTSIQAELGIPGSKNREQLFLEGYDYYLDAMKKLSTEQYKDILTLFDQRFPTSDTRLNREYSRLMGLLKDTRASTTEVILKQITPASAGVEDIHSLMVLAALNTKLSAEQLVIVTDALIKLEAKYLQKQVLRERNWFIRLREVVEILIKHNPLLANSIAQHPHFGQANQLLYLTTEVVPSQNLISRLEKIITDDPDYVWSSRLIEILSHAPTPATLEKFRDKWMEEPHLRVSLLPVLAKHPKEQDRHIFMDGLKLSDDRCVQISIVALSLLTEPNPENRDKEIAILIQRLRQDNSKKLNDLIQNRLRELTLKQSPPATLQLGRDWESWATQQYPSMVPWLHNSEGTPLVTWKLQHPHLDWNKADLISGERLYQKYCSACHRGSSALGPDLSGIGRRFSRDDILTAILQPSKDVSSRYRTSIIVAKDGKVHSGLIIYEAVDGVILQTSADSTVRILGDQIESRRLSDRSLMPAGLLDGLTDQEIASLIGWLQMQ